MHVPMIIQGGMGAAVSDWRLARAVAQLGHLGVVSGTALNTILARRLQDGDPGGHMRRALANFPMPAVAQRIEQTYFIAGGKAPEKPYKAVTVFTARPPRELLELTVVANFVEVFLAKEGHNGITGINLLEKIQLPNLASLYGAMLAGVDYVLMGAGIPREIPGVLDLLAQHLPASLKLHVEGEAPGDDYRTAFDPRALFGEELPPLRRPAFLAIVASATLALALARKASGYVDGFVVEGPTAGGHNAPPRGAAQHNERGEPIYGPRDQVDLAQIRDLGRPFWLAGSYADPHRLQDALALGASGIQVGTAFALCNESGLEATLKQALIQHIIEGTADIYTDPHASPTGFPFKVAQLAGTLSESPVYEARPRICDLGYLRTIYKRKDGTLGYRCPAEPISAYLKKGGKLEDTVDRKCLCNALTSNVGVGQQRPSGYHEDALVTLGDDVKNIARILRPGQNSYTAHDVIAYLTAIEVI